VETPSGTASSAAVTKVEVWDGRVWLAATQVEFKLTGEAAFIELAPEHYLIALLDEHTKGRFHQAVKNRMHVEKGGRWWAQIADFPDVVTPTEDNYPTLDGSFFRGRY
jgi:hypothetical protein